MPGRRRRNYSIEVAERGTPTEKTSRLRRIGHKVWGVSEAALHFRNFYPTAHYGGDFFNHVANRMTAFGTQIQRGTVPSTCEVFKRSYVSVSEISDMNVISHSSTVGRVKIRPKN